MTAFDAANLLADRWPATAMISPETKLPLCIETTRHVVEAFHRAGVPEAKPMPCALFAFNQPATLVVLGGLDDAPGACRIEVSPEAMKRMKRTSKTGWAGHLIVDHPDFILDLVLPGVIASTGATGFDNVTPFAAEKHNQIVDVDGAWMAMTEDGMCFRYEPRPRMASWRQTAAWRGDVDEVVVDSLAEHIRRVL